jgi:hypothetical protein
MATYGSKEPYDMVEWYTKEHGPEGRNALMEWLVEENGVDVHKSAVAVTRLYREKAHMVFPDGPDKYERYVRPTIWNQDIFSMLKRKKQQQGPIE